MKVEKRNGMLEDVNLEKVHNMLLGLSKDLDVSISQVELSAKIQLFNGIKTQDIDKMLTKSAADLISEDQPDYALLAGRLLMASVRKQAYGSFTPVDFYTHIKTLTEKGLYDKGILGKYSEAEIKSLEGFIDHERDLNLAYAGAKQLESKYLLQNRVTGKIYESPQYLYMLVAMCLFEDYEEVDGKTRLYFVIDFYNKTSLGKISLPTPIMGGVRTPTRQFSSCTLIECGDSLDSINASSAAIVKYISQRAGVGINGGAIRALGSPIRNGEAKHTGVIPFWKHFQTAVKSCSQGALRGGASTLFYPIWHKEFESLIVLKNNRGTEESRIRHLDYAVQISGLFYKRFLSKGNISLFSPNAVEGMYEAFFNDQELFEKLYTEAEADLSIERSTVSAHDLFSKIAQERAGTGRIYIQNVDHCNTHSPFDAAVAPIRQSNLCLEIALPTKPLDNINDDKGEIALCTLAALNLGKIEDLSDLEDLCEMSVRALDNLLDYQDYPLISAELSSKGRRTLGIGTINYANYLAKRGLKYSDGSANRATHELFEAIQFYLLKASNKIAKEKGACSKFNETMYAKGIMPTETYKKTVDTLCDNTLLLPWDELREDILKYGLRNSTLSALMPSETSSQVSNATNGIEPPRGFITAKASKDGVLRQAVPELKEYKDNYELLWDIPDNKGYLELVAIMQKFVDQSISANTNYDPAKFKGGKVPVSTIIRDLLTAYKLGVKTLYYHNTRDGSSDGVELEDESCESGGCKI